MRTQRATVDYALQRRAVLADVFAGRLSTTDVCDAHPYLVRAARYHGEPAPVDCPLCRRERLTHVTYVYGEELKRSSGSVRSQEELAEMAREFAEFRVYVVEVCQGCGWNHLATSYVLGTAGRPASRSGRRAAEE